MSNTLGYLRGELKSGESRYAKNITQLPKKKRLSFGKRVLEVGFVKKILLAVYNKIFKFYYE